MCLKCLYGQVVVERGRRGLYNMELACNRGNIASNQSISFITGMLFSVNIICSYLKNGLVWKPLSMVFFFSIKASLNSDLVLADLHCGSTHLWLGSSTGAPNCTLESPSLQRDWDVQWVQWLGCPVGPVGSWKSCVQSSSAFENGDSDCTSSWKREETFSSRGCRERRWEILYGVWWG